MWCKENSKEGSANSNGFLASTTAINMGVAKNRTSRGKQYGHRVLQRLRHFLHCKNKLLFCLPQCSPLITYQAACTWQFRKLWTQASTEWGLPQWSMWRFKTKVCCFTYSPSFLHEGVADAGPVPVHSLATDTKSETTVMDTAGVAATQTDSRTAVHRQLPQ